MSYAEPFVRLIEEFKIVKGYKKETDYFLSYLETSNSIDKVFNLNEIDIDSLVCNFDFSSILPEMVSDGIKSGLINTSYHAYL